MQVMEVCQFTFSIDHSLILLSMMALLLTDVVLFLGRFYQHDFHASYYTLSWNFPIFVEMDQYMIEIFFRYHLFDNIDVEFTTWSWIIQIPIWYFIMISGSGFLLICKISVYDPVLWGFIGITWLSKSKLAVIGLCFSDKYKYKLYYERKIWSIKDAPREVRFYSRWGGNDPCVNACLCSYNKIK